MQRHGRREEAEMGAPRERQHCRRARGPLLGQGVGQRVDAGGEQAKLDEAFGRSTRFFMIIFRECRNE
jgi:hypothetical protein